MEKENKMIAEFMGYEVKHNKCYSPKYNDGTIAPMQFHKSWDWLMPVVERIEFEYDCLVIINSPLQVIITNKDIGQRETPLLDEVFEIEVSDMGTKRECVYKAVIQYIKFYNETKLNIMTQENNNPKSNIFPTTIDYSGKKMKLEEVVDERKAPKWDSKFQRKCESGKACIIHSDCFHALYLEIPKKYRLTLKGMGQTIVVYKDTLKEINDEKRFLTISYGSENLTFKIEENK